MNRSPGSPRSSEALIFLPEGRECSGGGHFPGERSHPESSLKINGLKSAGLLWWNVCGIPMGSPGDFSQPVRFALAGQGLPGGLYSEANSLGLIEAIEEEHKEEAVCHVFRGE